MFIGIVTMKKDFVETVQINANNDDEATKILANYVYTKYNQDIPMGGIYYTGVVISTKGLETIGNKEPQAC